MKMFSTFHNKKVYYVIYKRKKVYIKKKKYS